MVPPHFKKQTPSIKQRFVERRKILRPFVKLYGNPVLVHAVHDKEVFCKIIKEGKLKLPSKHSSSKKTPMMEKIMGTDKGIYYSLGFQYLTSYGWKYGIIFNLDYIKELDYYWAGIHQKAYKIIFDYWYEKDRNYLEEFASMNKTTRQVINTYYHKKYKGQVRKIVEFWKVEKDLYKFFEKYPSKRKIINLIQKMVKKRFLKYPASKKHASKIWLEDTAPELVGKKENNLLKNSHFLGFYAIGKIPGEVKKILKEKYSNKILFDGKKMRKL
jgi:hypothetical protein